MFLGQQQEKNFISIGVISITSKQNGDDKPCYCEYTTVQLPELNRHITKMQPSLGGNATVLSVESRLGHKKRKKSQLPPFTLL
ncbi:hypothetical protein [uncultured Bacteroides sp.]|uniref:hypothetical protein n=1 Tax=uncultured Bacteroides sp. TaxID=162156 RepID=UPI002AA62981|nr:hypothetical protein [uncultured Bacteroides sp.]